MKKILITNDDGISSDGIIRLANAAVKYGEVWVIAPDTERSAMSHSITLRESIDVYPADFPIEGVHAYKCSGTPADCVRFGILNFVKEKPDLVISGINYGYNCGSDIQYSATVGAAMEGATVGVLSIAFSEGATDCHPVTDAYLAPLLEELMDRPLKKDQIWNVNFPACPLASCKGILRDRRVAETAVYCDCYLEEQLPGGGIRLRVVGDMQKEAEEGTDFDALLHDHISIGIVNNVKEG